MDGDRTERSSIEPTQPLDVSRYRRPKLLVGWIFSLVMHWRVQRWLRRWVPFPKLFGLRWVLRDEHVREVLSRTDIFQVDGKQICKANGGPNFMLGMEYAPPSPRGGCPFHRAKPADQLTYGDWQAAVMRHFKLEDLPRVAAIVEREAELALADQHEVDAVRGVITRTALAVVRDYYGIAARDPEDFASYACIVSHYMFEPKVSKELAEIGPVAAARLNAQLTAAIELAKQARRGEPRTVAERLVQDPALSDDAVRVILFGMTMGFVPTSTMAVGHALDVLLDRPDALAHAQAAARAARRDDEQLRRCLLEAMRWKPLLREPLRVCQQPYTVGEGTTRQRRFEQGERVLVMTASAMMDERSVVRPREFQPDRAPHELLVFGYGQHRCIGAPIAEVHMVSSLRALLSRVELRRTAGKRGRLQSFGPFPEHLFVALGRPS